MTAALTPALALVARLAAALAREDGSLTPADSRAVCVVSFMAGGGQV